MRCDAIANDGVIGADDAISVRVQNEVSVEWSAKQFSRTKQNRARLKKRGVVGVCKGRCGVNAVDVVRW